MSPDLFKKAEEVFLELADLPREQWGTLLDERCGADESLKASVRELLGFHVDGNDALDRPEFLTQGMAGLRRDEPEEVLPPGTIVGAYTIRGLLGTGGMGSVYTAEQQRPRRTVALKVIRRGLSTHALLRRFEHEAEMLGRLHHPGIAQIYHAGAAPVEFGGMPQPFIAMELVRGPALHKYAEQRRLTTREKLEVVARICDAVHHAHQRGVIHRDLKPQNILVDESGQPKILDFGVARAADSDLRVTTLQTSVGQLIGTLPYMSPEQVVADPSEVDTRSDVYAIGVVLYQLLTGRLPLDVSSRPIPEAARVIRDEAPAKLSAVNKLFRGDIETIVAKAMEKEKARRYQSAAELADDLRRYLAGEPISAKTDSTFYVIAKQIRRHKGVCAAAAVFVLGIIAFAVYAIVQANHSQRLALAETLAHNRARSALSIAESERSRADAQAERLRRNLYLSDIGYAQAAQTAHDVERVKRILDRCPEDLRGWEWRYLQKIADDTVFSVSASPTTTLIPGVSPDCRFAVYPGLDGTARVVDAMTGEEYVKLSPRMPEPTEDGRAAPVPICTRAIFSHDGATALFSWHSGELQRWDIARGDVSVLREGGPVLPAPASLPTLLEFSPDDTLILATLPNNLGCALLSAATFEPVREIPVVGHLCFGFSPDGQTLAFGFPNGTVRLVDARTGEIRRILTGHTNQVRGLAFSPDGLRLATASADTTARLWDLDTGESAVLRGSQNKLLCVAWSPDSLRVLAGGTDRVLFVFDAHSGDLLQSHAGHSNTIQAVMYAPDPRWAVTVGADRTVRWWTDVGQPKEVSGLVRDRSIWAATMLRDASAIVVGDSGGVVRFYEPRSMRQFRAVQAHAGAISGMVLSADGAMIATSGWDSVATLINIAEGKVIRRFDQHPPRSGPSPNRLLDVALAPDGSWLATGADDGVLRIWDTATGSKLREINVGAGPMTSLALSGNGTLLATGTLSDRTIRLWNTSTWEPVRTLKGHKDYSWELRFSRDGSKLLSAGEDSVILLWDLAGDAPPKSFRGHQGAVQCAAFSPDETRIVSSGWDNTVRLWHLDSGEELLNLRANIGAVQQCGFTPDGERIYSASNYGELKVWDASPRPHRTPPRRPEPPAPVQAGGETGRP